MGLRTGTLEHADQEPDASIVIARDAGRVWAALSEATLRRPVDNRSPLVAGVFARVVLGDADTHAVALEKDMHTTLERLKDYVERALRNWRTTT